MIDARTQETWSVSKPAITGRGGLVATTGCGCEKRLVGVAYVRDFQKKVLNVFLSGKSCEV